jgi:uncharacterized membrane protein
VRVLEPSAPDVARRVRDPLVVAWGLAGLTAAGLAWASFYRHSRFGSNAYDLGLFDQTVWGYSSFDLLPNTILRLPNPMGFHFHPIIMSLAPLYWIWEDARVLLLAQAGLIALSGIPVFLFARERLGSAAALLFELAYLTFWGVLGANLFDFHEVAFAAPILGFALYGLLTGRMRLLWAMVPLGLLTREDLALTFAAIGIYLALSGRRRSGLVLVALSMAWFLVTVELIVPRLADGSYPWQYTNLGSGPGDALVHVLTNPIDTVQQLFSPYDKRLALLNLFVPWLALPLLSPVLLIALPTLAERFLSDNPSHWAPQGFHYSLVVSPILAIAAVDATARVARWSGRAHAAVAAGAAVVLVGAYFSFVRLEPLDELRRLTPDERAADIRACLSEIPSDASVAATSALVPHLSQRSRIWVLDDRRIPETDVYAIDLSTWTFPFAIDDVARLVASKRGDYGVSCSRGSVAILERGAPNRGLSSEFAGLVAGASAQP